jgi:hypothetical protein
VKPDIEVPEGFALIKKGGRPKNTLRDIAVFLAHPIKKTELGKGYLADEWIVEYFKLTDASHIRKCRQNARRVVSNHYFAYGQGQFMFLFPASKRDSGPVIPGGTIGWAWTEGCPEALEVRMKSDANLRDIVSQPTMRRQDKRENW